MGHHDERLFEYLEIKTIIEGAFKPLRCALKDDYEHKFNFRVYDGENCVYRVENVLVSDVCERDSLMSFLAERRAEVRNKGFNLDPWDVPGSI